MCSLTRPCNTHPRVCFHLMLKYKRCVKLNNTQKFVFFFFFPTSLVFCVKYKRSRFVFMSFSSTKEISLLSVVIGISTIESVSLWWNRTGEKIKGATLSVVCVCPMAAAPVIVLPFSLHPFNLFILAAHTARTVLLYSNCILSIIKACFPWLLWCWNGTRGAIHIRPKVPSLQSHTHPCTHFCANSRIPIYILAVDLNYCKHLRGPVRHNRLAESCIVSVPPTGSEDYYTTVLWLARHYGLLQTLWNVLLCLDSLLSCSNIC